ncbi:MAG: ATP-binding cassette domain-containing protein, partial [Hallerella sp.]|nr:ATP-binding cassette domain-containing protein [Hallerella sp.]
MNSVLQVKDLSVAFGFDKNGKPRDGMTPLQVTDRVSFDIAAGEFFALVGESGCGKSVTAMSILRLLPQPSAKIVEGSVLYNADENAAPVDLAKLPIADLQKVRGSEISCIFQEPMQALNPVVTIRKQLMEVFKFCRRPKGEFLSVIREQLALAGFKDVERVLNSYPHEL